MGIIYICCTPVGRSIIESHLIHHPEIPISGIINLKKEKAIKKANFDSLFDLSQKNDIELLYCSYINSEKVKSFIKNKNPVLIIQSGWSQKFDDEILKMPKYGCIGQHPSPIPIGRGAACVNWAIIQGKKNWADSFFKMSDVYDDGPVYAQKFFTIEEFDNVKTIYDKIAFTSYMIIKQYLSKWYRGAFENVYLDESKATYYKKRKPEDGEIDFKWSDRKIFNYVRALTTPYPGAYFIFNNIKIIILKAQLLNKSSNRKIGEYYIDKKINCVVFSVGDVEKKLIGFERIKIGNLPEMYGNDFNLINEIKQSHGNI